MRPITGDVLYDYVLAIIVLIIGFGAATKGDKTWGWVVAALAVLWASQLTRGMGLI